MLNNDKGKRKRIVNNQPNKFFKAVLFKEGPYVGLRIMNVFLMLPWLQGQRVKEFQQIIISAFKLQHLW